MNQILVTGCSGRMGQAVIAATEETPEAAVAACHDVGQDLAEAIGKADTAIDFTIHSFTKQVLEAAKSNGTRLVIGTTGHSGEERAAWWERAVAVFPTYTEYMEKTDREIPVFVTRRS